jgi:hypothetical protein
MSVAPRGSAPARLRRGRFCQVRRAAVNGGFYEDLKKVGLPKKKAPAQGRGFREAFVERLEFALDAKASFDHVVVGDCSAAR